MTTGQPGTGINAAWAAGRIEERLAVDTFHELPMGFELLGCPNCGDPDHLALIEDTRTHRRVLSAVRAVGTTEPDLTDAEPAPIVVEGPDPKLLGVRCENCRWSRESPDAAHYLRAVQ